MVPTDRVSIAVALADKLDTLTGFWAIDEKPTGSKDPYALRRAALGIVRLILENKISFALKDYFQASRNLYYKKIPPTITAAGQKIERVPYETDEGFTDRVMATADAVGNLQIVGHYLWDTRLLDLLAFFHDRLKVYLRDQGQRHDLIDAVLASGQQDDLLMIVKRVEALDAFLATDDGTNLLAGFRRAANILKAEEKKDGKSYNEAVDLHLIKAKGEPEEKVLAEVLDVAARHASEHVAKEDFAGAMKALAELRPAVDAFFDKILVNAEDKDIRANRLRLLASFREATRAVADFSAIAGG